jgi:hypothetical protein
MSYKIVVARYNENIRWLEPELDNCIIYNKGEKLNVRNEIMLPNVGRESETYLQYIIANYNHLPDVIVFTQGRISDCRGCGDDVRYLLYMKDSALQHSKAQQYIRHYETDSHINCWDREWNVSQGRYYLHDNYRNQHRVTFLKWFEEHVNENYPNPINIYLNGIFAVRKDAVLKRPIEYYERMLQEVNHQNDPAEGHFFERSWYYIFS